MNDRRRWLRDNGLLLACLGLFVLFFAGMVLSGSAAYTEEQREHGSPQQVSVLVHAAGGVAAFNAEQLHHGQPPISVWRYVTTSQFWFESMQNWQSEFIAVAAIVGLSIFLRQRGSAESKPVAEPHRWTSA